MRGLSHREVPELLMYGPVADEDFIAVRNGGGPMQLGCPARLSEAQKENLDEYREEAAFGAPREFFLGFWLPTG